MPAEVSIIIPVYNRAKALRAVMPSYFAQQDVSQLIIVDDASNAETKQTIQELADKSPFQVEVVTHDSQQGQQRSRLSGIAKIKNPLVLFGEDDVWLDPSYVNTLKRQMDEFEAQIIAGRILNQPGVIEFNEQDLVQQEADDLTKPILDASLLKQRVQRLVEHPIEAPFLHTIALIKSEVLENTTFDPGYLGNGLREETDFYVSAIENGYKVMYTSDATCWHLRGPICGTGGHRINRLAYEYWSLRNTLRFFRKHQTTYRSHFGINTPPLALTWKWFLDRQREQYQKAKRGQFSSFSQPKDGTNRKTS